MNQKSVGEVKAILNEAAEEGVLSEKALQIIDVNDTVLQGIDGTDVDDILSTEVTLFTLVTDDTGSIEYAGLTDAVIDGQNMTVEALAGSKQKDDILMAQWKLGTRSNLLHSYIPVEQAEKLTPANYYPAGGTALYDVWVEVLTANIVYAEQLKAYGTAVKNVAVLITDGQDTASLRYHTADCKKLNEDLLKSEQFILAFVGVAKDKQDEQLFRKIAAEMGFPVGAVLTAGATPSEVRKVFNMVSQSAIRASQKAISAVAQNTFFNP